ncbi:DUF4230 domain-containing protein [Aquimarina sp. 2201CG5-10]|uniref:DUF4230 domain-containing protein n=1 Tax=Aquimarina callyspongiae TaxID=3098150 RepID=UPI002AB421FA|nr:DUF4230 domain-containing protein [Aquimarina sp. 2201CG5-10]MDY8136440.1 DUF4230 domain-containing protein [Aquimarina sp. 2201CG5-10]
MRNFLLGALIAAFIALSINFLISHSRSQKTELESSDLILNQIKNVGKLVVTEGHFSEVITYKDAKKFYLDILTAEKKAIVVVNATVTISYDLSKIKHLIDKDSKTLTITSIPDPEININPDIKYHNLEENFFNQFTPEDHNLIQKQVIEQLNKKAKKSSLNTNAQNRLISELQKIYIVTNSLGWTLKFNETLIDGSKNIEELLP